MCKDPCNAEKTANRTVRLRTRIDVFQIKVLRLSAPSVFVSHGLATSNARRVNIWLLCLFCVSIGLK